MHASTPAGAGPEGEDDAESEDGTLTVADLARAAVRAAGAKPPIPSGWSLFEGTRKDGWCLLDSISIAITEVEKNLQYRISAAELLDKLLGALARPSAEMNVLVESFIVSLVSDDSSAAAWAIANPNLMEGFDNTGLPNTIDTTSNVGNLRADFAGWLKVLQHKDARYHFAEFPDRLFAFILRATSLLYSGPARELCFNILGDEVYDFNSTVSPERRLCYLHKEGDHYMVYLPKNYIIPPERAPNLDEMIFADLVESKTIINFADVQLRLLLENAMDVSFRFDGKGNKLEKNSFTKMPLKRVLSDFELETAEKMTLTWLPLLESPAIPSIAASSCGCVYAIPAHFVEGDTIYKDAHCPEIAVGRQTISWGGVHAVKYSGIISLKQIKEVVQIRNGTSGLGADQTPDFDSESSNQQLLDELHWIADLYNATLQRGDNAAGNCTNGRSRSPAGVAAYLLKFQKLSWDDAKAKVDKAMADCHGTENPMWSVFDRDSRFELHLRAIAAGVSTWTEFQAFRFKQVANLPRNSRSVAADAAADAAADTAADVIEIVISDGDGDEAHVKKDFNTRMLPDVTNMTCLRHSNHEPLILNASTYSHIGAPVAWPHPRGIHNIPDKFATKEGYTQRVAAFEPASGEPEATPLMSVTIDVKRFQHFRAFSDMPPVEMEMLLGGKVV